MNCTVDQCLTVFGARFENSPPCCQQTWQSVWFREHTSTQLRMQDDNERVNKMTLPSKKEEKGIKWGKLNFRHFVVDFVRPVHWQHFLAAPGLFQVFWPTYRLEDEAIWSLRHPSDIKLGFRNKTSFMKMHKA